MQLSGINTPPLVPPMFLHEDVAALFIYVSFMSCNVIPVHGLLGLQSNVTASGVADVPCMFLYFTSLIFTPEVWNHKKKKPTKGKRKLRKLMVPNLSPWWVAFILLILLVTNYKANFIITLIYVILYWIMTTNNTLRKYT